jgi:hypothetical protein
MALLTLLTIEEGQTTFYYYKLNKSQFLPSISFVLWHQCLSTGLHCTVAKWQGRFLMKVNDLTGLFFFALL